MLSQRLSIFLITVLLFTLTTAVSCTSSTNTPKTTSSPTVSGVSFSIDIQSIFNLNCVVCHQGTTPPSGLSLETSSAYKNLVNVKSTQSQLMMVVPGATDQSYLVNKLLGTQEQVGGNGVQMPYGTSPLEQHQINIIQKWITQGALDN